MKNMEFGPTQPYHIAALRRYQPSIASNSNNIQSTLDTTSEDQVWEITPEAKVALAQFIVTYPTLATQLAQLIVDVRGGSIDMYHALDQIINPEANQMYIATLGFVPSFVQDIIDGKWGTELQKKTQEAQKKQLDLKKELQAKQIQIFIKDPELVD